ncbi:hypothetical protein M3Y99_01319300 [Aphelenchoides fujianensis]|nr:hypothetical protein M3Y99_01319300 [Aphelenchoides fujianensis]
MLPAWIYTVNEGVALVGSVAVNLALWYLINYASTNDLRSYTRLLKLHCVTDLLYTLFNGFASMRVIYVGKTIVIVCLGPLAYWSRTVAIAAICLFSYAFMTELTFTWIDYYYRFVLLCRNDPFTNRRLAVCILLSVVVTAIHTGLSSYLACEYYPSPRTLPYWEPARQQLQLAEEVLPYAIYDPENKYMNLTMFSGTAMTVAVYATITYCTIRINQTLKENARRRAKKESRRVTRQIALVMILQATLPFIVLALPVLLISILTFLSLEMNLMGPATTLSMSWTPFLKAFSTIWIVTPYRRLITRKVVGSWAAPATTTASAENSFSHSQPTNTILSSPLLRHSEELKADEQIFL